MFVCAPPPYIRVASQEDDVNACDVGDEQLLANHEQRRYTEVNGDSELLNLTGDLYDSDDDQLILLERQLQREKDEENKRNLLTTWRDGFGRFLVRYPSRFFPGSLLMLLILFTLFGVAGYFCYHYHPPQEFIDEIQNDPVAGFETRGTYIKKGQFTARELYSEVRLGKKYSAHPNISLAFEKLNIDQSILQKMYGPFKQYGHNSSSKKKRSVKKFNQTTSPDKSEDSPQGNHYNDYHYNGEFEGTEPPIDPTKYSQIGNPHLFYVFAFESVHQQEDLYSHKSMMTLCDLEKNTILPLFNMKSDNPHVAYQYVYSLPRIIANHYQKDCAELTQADLDQFKAFFTKCLHSFSYLFKEGKAAVDIGGVYQNRPKSTTPRPQSIPHECQVKKQMLLELREYIVDKEFTNLTLQAPLTYTNMMVFAGDKRGLDFYHENIENKVIMQDEIKMSGVNFQDDKVKWDLFQDYLLKDTLWFGLAFGLVFLVMLVYTLRVDLIISTILCVLFGFVFAYFIYYFILKMKFFPFINLLALLVLIAVGADDVFVFFDIFKQIKTANPDLPLERVISKTLSHAALSVFVTSLTTSAAFFANSVSSITAIKVFGIFAGIAVIVNFFVMVIMIPSVIVLCELFTEPLKRFLKKRNHSLHMLFCCGCPTTSITSFAANIYDKYFPRLIEKAWFVFLPVLTILGIGSGIIVFVTPRFKLPVSNDFQLFPTSNLIESWDLNIKNNFYFAKDEVSTDVVTAYYIWGFKDLDAGNQWDPKDQNRPLVEDPSFNFYSPETQNWLTQFCNDVKKADYMPDYFDGWGHCNLDAYSMVAKTVCKTVPWMAAAMPKCCADRDLPFDSEQLEVCLPAYQALLFNYLHLNINTNVSGGIFGDVIYETSTNEVKGFLLLVQTKWPATFTYDLMDHYYDILANGFLKRIETSPEAVKNGFVAFKDWFWLYDLQHSLATGTYTSIGLSLAVAFLVMLFTSLNVLITLYAMLSISLAILCTVASIVLMGWHLNIIESVIISLSVGLSIDFTIHYGVAYRLSPNKDPKQRVQDSFHQVGPAVAMAALTTFLAGASIMPCRVLPYTKLGIFLMLVMAFAWTYANFYFQSLCRIIGPSGNFCQLSAVCQKKRKIPENNEAEQQQSQTQGMTLRRVDSDDSLLVTF